jgi:hypothetical protein
MRSTVLIIDRTPELGVKKLGTFYLVFIEQASCLFHNKIHSLWNRHLDCSSLYQALPGNPDLEALPLLKKHPQIENLFSQQQHPSPIYRVISSLFNFDAELQ